MSGARYPNGRKRGKNIIEICGDYAKIYLKYHDQILTSLVDAEDVPKILSLEFKIYPYNTERGFYAVSYGRQYFKLIHRYLTNAPDGMEVDHINHNTLDNRKSNLRVVPKYINQLNRASGQKNNHTSGIAGVTWDKRDSLWRVQIKRNNKNFFVKEFKNLEDARICVEQKRKELIDNYEQISYRR